MLRSLGLVFCVVVMAAFIFGCGGGGGGTAQMPDPMPVDPGPTQPTEPTDNQRINEARRMVAGILSDASEQASAASSNLAAIQTNTDATAGQIASAVNQNAAAQAALRLIENANRDAIAASTPDAAQTALDNAKDAQNTLDAAASAITSIQTDLQAIADNRDRQRMDELALTGGSSLIKHLRDNRKVSDAVLGGLGADSLVVGQTVAGTNEATYPFHKGSTSPAIPQTQYPKPANIDRGVLAVTVTVDDGTGTATALSSNSETGKITGSGRLPNGFDLKDDNGNFATVYTDITVARQVRQKDSSTDDDLAANDPATEGIDERYQYIADTDYLLAGFWLDDATAGTSTLRAFAFGSQPLAAAPTPADNFCTAADVTDSTSLTRNCVNAAGRNFNEIIGFVDENESETATYTGGVDGAYFAGGQASHFNADVSLTAKFVRGSGDNVAGSNISGEITGIRAGRNSINGRIDLKEQDLAALTNLSSAFETGEAAGVIEGHAYTGTWKGQFFGMKATRLRSEFTGTVATNDRTETRTYTPDMPGSVAGSFYLGRQTVGEGDAAFIGAFGAHR